MGQSARAAANIAGIDPRASGDEAGNVVNAKALRVPVLAPLHRNKSLVVTFDSRSGPFWSLS
jgi:hypothetical protein